jgi:hypothetical protein
MLTDAFEHAQHALGWVSVIVNKVQTITRKAKTTRRGRQHSAWTPRQIAARRPELQRLAPFVVDLQKQASSLSNLSPEVHSWIAACYPVTAPPISVWGESFLTGLEAAEKATWRVVNRVLIQSEVDGVWTSAGEIPDSDFVNLINSRLFTGWPSAGFPEWEDMELSEIQSLRFIIRRERAAALGMSETVTSRPDLISYADAARIAHVDQKTIGRWASGASSSSFKKLTPYVSQGTKCVSESELREKLSQWTQSPRRASRK